MNVLMVDNDRLTAKVIAEVLRNGRHQIAAAYSGVEALALFERSLFAFDLVVMEVVLPDADGFEVCRRLRLKDSCMRILVLTTKDSLADKLRAFDAGADDFMTKPFSPRDLLARVQVLER